MVLTIAAVADSDAGDAGTGLEAAGVADAGAELLGSGLRRHQRLLSSSSRTSIKMGAKKDDESVSTQSSNMRMPFPTSSVSLCSATRTLRTTCLKKGSNADRRTGSVKQSSA